MVCLPPPHLAGNSRSYLEAYNEIIAAHRRSPLASASSVIMLVGPNVDALSAARMLASLFKQDDVVYRIIPVSGMEYTSRLVQRSRGNKDVGLCTLILINIGAMFDLVDDDWFGTYDPKVTIHVIDSSRPMSLRNIFARGQNAERVLIWNDEDISQLTDMEDAWKMLEYEVPPNDSDDEDSGDELDEKDDQRSDDDDDDEGGGGSQSENGSPSHKRRKDVQHSPRKRRRIQEGPSAEEFDRARDIVDKHYRSGLYYGQSAASTVYILATLLERVDNDFLWLAILGLTYQYTTSRISRNKYDAFHTIYYDEVSRLNPLPSANDNSHSLLSINPDDMSVRTSEELRFTLFRHWTLYDAMFHSSYIASKLGIWKEKGRQRLTGLLAKMGFSIPQTQQPYSHMDMDLKRSLIQKLNDIAPEYGLIELSYPSFMRCFGFHSQPLSAADAVEGISALLDVAGGMRMEVEVEGMRNGGEWFGGGRVWDSRRAGKNAERRLENGEVEKSTTKPAEGPKRSDGGNDDDDDDDDERDEEPEWWVKNFWTAYDALTDIKLLRESLSLAMSLQRAIIRQGTSIIDKQDIKTMRNHRVVIMSQGPDLALFAHPGVLVRLALWLVDALRDRLPGTVVGRSKKKSLPFVIACLDETNIEDATYTVVGIMGALDFDEFRKNAFAYTFTEAATRMRIVYSSAFDANVFNMSKNDLKPFLEALCG